MMMQRFTKPREIRKYSTTKLNLAKFLASDKIERICGETFRARGHELEEKPGIPKADLLKVIGSYDGLIVRSGTKVDKDIIAAGTNLKVIGRAGTGYDNIDVVEATKRGILVANTPGGNTTSTAELAVTHILSLARKLPQASSSFREGKWERTKYTGTEVSGKVLGIVGIGRIGAEVAKVCQALKMKTIGFDPILSPDAALNQGIEPVTFEELIAQSDFITIHTPLNKDTNHLFNDQTFAKCKRGLRIVNCARGGIVDEEALLRALNSGQVAGAALDVLEVEPPSAGSISPELRCHPNIVVSPHLGASTFDAQERVARAIAENLSEILSGGAFTGVVNAPDFGLLSQSPLVRGGVGLGEVVGSVHAQLLKGKRMVKAVRIEASGLGPEVGKGLEEVLKAAVLKGLFSELTASPLTLVNAPPLAKERGVKVSFVNADQKKGLSPSNTELGLNISLEVEGIDNHFIPTSLHQTPTPLPHISQNIEIQGQVTVSPLPSTSARFVMTKIGHFSVDLPPYQPSAESNIPEPQNLLLLQTEKKGAVGTAGMMKVLVEALNEVDFDYFVNGKDLLAVGKEGLAAVILNAPLSGPSLERIKNMPGITDATMVKLSHNPDPHFRIAPKIEAPPLTLQGAIMTTPKPSEKPLSPNFSSGPCKKRPGYSLSFLSLDSLGRSHRSKLGKQRLAQAIERTKEILGVPKGYLVGIVPGSDTGAFEMAMWSMLGQRPVDCCYWESFGKGWKDDVVKQLQLPKESTREISATYGELPDLSTTNPDHDILFTFNGTTSGVRVPNLDFISSDRKGLAFNDATSAAFAMDIDWNKSDVTTFSWQKVLGGEGAHGMLILSPRAVERLETFQPPRPLPKIFRMTKNDPTGKRILDSNIFKGDTINTPSMLCVEDYLDALQWADKCGGLQSLVKRSQENLKVLEEFTQSREWIKFLAINPATRSSTSVCLTLPQLSKDQVKTFVGLLESENVALDIGSYRDAPPGLRIWCGATVEKEDLQLLMPWMDWAYEMVKN